MAGFCSHLLFHFFKKLYLNINFFFFYNVVLVSVKGAGVPYSCSSPCRSGHIGVPITLPARKIVILCLSLYEWQSVHLLRSEP